MTFPRSGKVFLCSDLQASHKKCDAKCDVFGKYREKGVINFTYQITKIKVFYLALALDKSVNAFSILRLIAPPALALSVSASFNRAIACGSAL